MKTIVIGIGSLLRGDDAAGIRIVEALSHEVLPQDVTLATTTAGGLALLEMMTGYDRAVIVDAIRTRDGNPGDVYSLRLEQLPAPAHAFTVHDVSLRTALDIGRRMGLPLPTGVTVVAVEAGDVTPLREDCTLAVEEAIPRAVEMVLARIAS